MINGRAPATGGGINDKPGSGSDPRAQFITSNRPALTTAQRRAIVQQARVLAEQAQAIEDVDDSEHLSPENLRDIESAATISIALSLVVIADALSDR